MQRTETNKLRDVELVQKTLKNADDFVEIVQHYQAPLRRYVTRLGCRDVHDVDDLLQEIFLKVYTNLNDYDADLPFSSWLYRIAHNETISFFRKKRVRPMPVATEEETHLFENITDEIDFIESLDAKISGEILHKALLGLEEQYRHVLILRFFEEKSYHEISDILKIPIGTVGTLLNRGKERLRDTFVTKKIHL